MALLSVAEALDRIVSTVKPVGSEPVGLLEAHGRVLALTLAAGHDQPPFAASAMDGYAVRAADVAGPAVRLRLVGQSAAGRGWRGTVGPGEAVRIFTGAPVPAGADAVIIQENAVADDAHVVINDSAIEPGHIRAKGLDFAEGEALLRAGCRLGAREITLAAAMGHGVLEVRRRPRVAILATGDELVPPGRPPGRDQIVCSNPFGVAAMVRQAGGDALFLGIARDTRQDLDAKLAGADGAEVLVTIGGASVGDHDLVAPVLQERGMALDFWKIAMRPGKPLMYGRHGAQHVLGLPGNPVSALICARIFLAPLIARLLGLPARAESIERAACEVPLAANGPRQHYARAVLTTTSTGLPKVRPVRSQDSSLLAPLVEANCLLVRPPSAPAAAAGSEVCVLRLDF